MNRLEDAQQVLQMLSLDRRELEVAENVLPDFERNLQHRLNCQIIAVPASFANTEQMLVPHLIEAIRS